MSLDVAIDNLRLWREHPLAMVRDVFHVEPDTWQADVLEDFPHNPMQAMACCKGPGKTAVLSWLGWNFLLTRPHPKVGAVAITGRNLADNLWPEMAKWQKISPLLMDQFEWGKERIFHKPHPETWFMTAKTYPQSASEEALGETLAGLWANHVLFLMDEAGGIPVAVMRAAQAALQREGTEGHLVIAGNTTSIEGCLYEACISRRHMWKPYEVTADPDDPKRTPRISVEYARQQILEFGRDNPWVMINILAKFPAQGINSLISPEEVRECISRHLHPSVYQNSPRILGGDVARFGDDRSILVPRQGKSAFDPLVVRSMDSIQVAGHFGQKANEWRADSIQIDGTGGYGAGVIDQMRELGFVVQDVQFAGKARDPRFYNKRSEIIWEACEWLKDGASISDKMQELVAEASTATYGFKGDKILIEPKELMKARLGRSPDTLDALACSFAYPVAQSRDVGRALTAFDLAGQVGKVVRDYDPLTR